MTRCNCSTTSRKASSRWHRPSAASPELWQALARLAVLTLQARKPVSTTAIGNEAQICQLTDTRPALTQVADHLLRVRRDRSAGGVGSRVAAVYRCCRARGGEPRVQQRKLGQDRVLRQVGVLRPSNARSQITQRSMPASAYSCRAFSRDVRRLCTAMKSASDTCAGRPARGAGRGRPAARPASQRHRGPRGHRHERLRRCCQPAPAPDTMLAVGLVRAAAEACRDGGDEREVRCRAVVVGFETERFVVRVRVRMGVTGFRLLRSIAVLPVRVRCARW